MNKISALLQSVALSLLLIGGAHASAAKTSSNRNAVVASAATTTTHKSKGSGKSASHHSAAHRSKKSAQKVNINTADADAIHQSLINIGASKAAAIVAWRKQHGAFHSADELSQVKGIGLKTIEKNRQYIVLGSVATTAKN